MIEFKDITLDFKKVRALNNINLQIKKGEYLVVLGPSGAGKTSLLKVLAGLYKPKKGKLFVDDVDYTKKVPEDRKIAYLPQNYALFPKLDVYDNVSYSPKLQSKNTDEINEITSEILNLVHLIERQFALPHELSGGMKQRVALSRALATNFSILLLDEPLRALDARLRIELRKELRNLARDLNFTVLHVTHDQNEAMAIADRILILNEGKIQQIGTQEEIYYKPKNEFVASFLDDVNKFEGKIKSVVTNDNRYEYVIETDEGLQLKSINNTSFRIGQWVNIIIKAETLKIKSNKGFDIDKENTYIGIIRKKYFLGNWTKLELEIKLSDGTILRKNWVAKIPSRRADKFQLGKDVIVQKRKKLIYLFSKEE